MVVASPAFPNSGFAFFARVQLPLRSLTTSALLDYLSFDPSNPGFGDGSLVGFISDFPGNAKRGYRQMEYFSEVKAVIRGPPAVVQEQGAWLVCLTEATKIRVSLFVIDSKGMGGGRRGSKFSFVKIKRRVSAQIPQSWIAGFTGWEGKRSFLRGTGKECSKG